MQQMPYEGRKFCLVDNHWKQLMSKAVVSTITGVGLKTPHINISYKLGC